jgi:hypothetical protein
MTLRPAELTRFSRIHRAGLQWGTGCIIDEQDRGILLEAIELVLVLAADEGREVTVGEVTLGLFNEYVSGERDPAKMAEAVMNAPRRVLH